MLKLKLQYFGHLMQTADSLKKTLTVGKVEGRRRRGRQRMRWLNGITVLIDMSLANSGRTGNLVCCSPWGCRESGMTYQLDNNIIFSINIYYSIFLSISIHYSTTGGVVFVHLLNFLSTIEKEYYTLMN